jgi:hypothetical protein
MIKVAKVEWVGGFRLRLRFNDDSIGGFDFAGIVGEAGPMVEPLRATAYFKRVFIEHGAPKWPNGFDLAPEWLYREIAAAGVLSRATHV